MENRYSDQNSYGEPRQLRGFGRGYVATQIPVQNPAEPQGYAERFAPPTQQPMQSGANGIVVYNPSTYEDVQRLIDHLKAREQVIVNFAKLRQDSVYRILDFMSGAVYALGGSIMKIDVNIFVFAPAGVPISTPPQFSRK